MTLQPPIAQADFTAGIVRVAPHLLPRNAVWNIENMLLDDDGSLFKRGGSVAVSNAAFDDGLRFIWTGQLAGGERTVFASEASIGTLDADGATPIDFSIGGIDEPMRCAVIEGIMFLGGYAYGGSRDTSAAYTTGTVAVTEGDETIVGTGTNWDPEIDAGMLLLIGDRLVAVRSRTDDTHLELMVPWGGATASGLSYSAKAVHPIPAVYHPNGIYAAVGGRLLSVENERIYMSKGGDSTTWDVTEYHQLPAGELPTAIEGLNDIAYAFTTGGIWAITNVPYDLTDDVGNPQQELERVSGDIVLWGAAGLAFWGQRLVVPATSGVWLFGGSEGPQLVSRSIHPIYVDYLRKGYTPGLATTFHGTLLLPVLGVAGVKAMLACRLDRPVEIRGFGRVYPWTKLVGAGVRLSAVASRVTGRPAVLAAEYAGACRVLELASFEPTNNEPLDHDGTPIAWEVYTRDIPTGNLNINLCKKLRLRYELDGDDAEIAIAVGTDARPAGIRWNQFVWDQAVWSSTGLTALPDTAPEDAGDRPKVWRVNKRARYVRARFRSSSPASRAVIRSIELFVRPSGRM